MSFNKILSFKNLAFLVVGASLVATPSFARKNDQTANSNTSYPNNQQSNNNQNSNNQAKNQQSGDEAVVKKLKALGYWDKNAKLIAQEMDAKNVNALKAVQNLNERRGKGDDIPVHHKDKLQDIK